MTARTGRDLLRHALRERLADPRVVLLGEAIGCHGVTEGFPDGPGVVRTPLSENGTIGLATGLALGGKRPIVEIVDPAGLARAADALDELATLHARSGGAFGAPVVIRAPYADVRIPEGISVVAASNATELAGMLARALAGDAPVVLLEAASAYDDVGEAAEVAPLGTAVVRKAGGPVTLLAAGDAVSLALAAAAEEDAEVVDLRSLQPLDTRTIGESVRRTGRAIAIGPSAPLLVALNEAFLHLESPLACVPPTAGHDALVRAIRECVRY